MYESIDIITIVISRSFHPWLRIQLFIHALPPGQFNTALEDDHSANHDDHQRKDAQCRPDDDSGHSTGGNINEAAVYWKNAQNK